MRIEPGPLGLRTAGGPLASPAATRTAAGSRRRRRPGPTPASSPDDACLSRRRAASAAGALAGVLVAVAWWLPGTPAGALLGWGSAALLVYAVRARRAYLPAYAAGLACGALGFYWIYGTLAAFGGFGTAGPALLFAAFTAAGAVQFLLFAFLHHNLGPTFEALALRAPSALVISELASLRLFRWHFGHTQVAFTPLAQAADLGGAPLISFLMFWVAEAGVRAVVFGERRRTLLLPVAALALAVGYGAARARALEAASGEPQEVVLVQGNVSLEERFDPESFRRGVERYHALSRRATRPGALIVWPEGAIPALVRAETRSAADDPALPVPRPGDRSAILLGTYCLDRAGRRYNAALPIRPDGSVAPPYYKQVLIPFGEYMPLAATLPWLHLDRLNENAGGFTAGTEAKVFDLPMLRADGTAYRLRAAPLICYEDTVPALARRATLAGAELLVNLTYDTWFGDTAAPGEHHLIAAFRAIENGRYLVRATNTGLSAVVDPSGRTIASLPPFVEGTASARVRLLKGHTVYARFVGDLPWWALLAAGLGGMVLRRARTPRTPAGRALPRPA